MFSKLSKYTKDRPCEQLGEGDGGPALMEEAKKMSLATSCFPEG